MLSFVFLCIFQAFKWYKPRVRIVMHNIKRTPTNKLEKDKQYGQRTLTGNSQKKLHLKKCLTSLTFKKYKLKQWESRLLSIWLAKMENGSVMKMWGRRCSCSLFTANQSVEWVNVLIVQFGSTYQFYFYEFILQKYLHRCPKMYIQRMFTAALFEEWKTGKNPNVYPPGI